MKMWNLGLFLVLSFILSSCAVPGTYMSASSVENTLIKINGHLTKPKIIKIDDHLILTQKPYQYRVEPYDILSVIVWNHPELTIPVQSALSTQINIGTIGGVAQVNPQETGILVDRSGKIFFPYVGRMKVSNLTLNQIRASLSHRLTRYLRRPQVSVRVAVFRSQQVSVIGEVLHPGTQSLTNKPLTLLDAINAAGGLNTVSADARHIYVLRGSFLGPYIYWADAGSPQQLLLAQHFVLRDRDIVYVAPSGVVSWNRIVSQILPTVQTVWYTHAMVQ